MSKYGHVKENIDIITIWVWYKLFGRKGKMAKSHCRLSLEKWPSISARREKGGCVSLSIKPDIVMMRLSMQQWKCYRIASNQTEESQPLKDRPNLEPNALSLASIGKCHGPPPQWSRLLTTLLAALSISFWSKVADGQLSTSSLELASC